MSENNLNCRKNESWKNEKVSGKVRKGKAPNLTKSGKTCEVIYAWALIMTCRGDRCDSGCT